MKNVSVIAFYSFFRIDDLVQMEKQVQSFFQPIDIKGTVLIGPEGLNGTIAVPYIEEKNTIEFLKNLGVDPQNIKVSKFDGKRVCNRFKTKIKKEIVISSTVNILEIWDKSLYETAIDEAALDFGALAEEVMGDKDDSTLS